MGIEELAKAIDEFAYAYDPYEYGDSVEDREQALIELVDNIRAGDLRGVSDWLKSIIDEEDQYEQEATQLYNLLQLYSK